jgi:hypothetical protein
MIQEHANNKQRKGTKFPKVANSTRILNLSLAGGVLEKILFSIMYGISHRNAVLYKRASMHTMECD